MPLLLEEQGLRDRLREGFALDKLTLSPSFVDQGKKLWGIWKTTVATKLGLEPVNIALVGKYTALPDSKHPPQIAAIFTPCIPSESSFLGVTPVMRPHAARANDRIFRLSVRDQGFGTCLDAL